MKSPDPGTHAMGVHEAVHEAVVHEAVVARSGPGGSFSGLRVSMKGSKHPVGVHEIDGP